MVFLVLLFVCALQVVNGNGTEYLPVLNGHGVPLTANIDVKKFNDKLKSFLTSKVPADIEEIFEKYVGGRKFAELLKSSAQPTIRQKVQVLFDKFIKSEEYNKDLERIGENTLKEIFEKYVGGIKFTELLKSSAQPTIRQKIQVLFDTFIKSEEYYKDLEKIGEGILEGKFESHIQSSEYKEIVKNGSVKIIEKLSDGMTNDTRVLMEKVNDMQRKIDMMSELPDFTDCIDVKDKGRTQSSVYNIGLTPSVNINVFCDLTTDGGGWIVFQRRMNGKVDFQRDWVSYKNGFGSLEDEFWLGNEKLHILTKNGKHELRVDLENLSGDKVYARYSQFFVGDWSAKYKLTVSGHSGTVGDSLKYHNGAAFTTKDQDNDNHSINCAYQLYRGGWWYKSCAASALNGLYGKKNWYGIYWQHWTNNSYNTKTSTMMIRKIG